MSKKATIREVAELAEVSIATVSRVLNNSPHVNEDTKAKVMEVIEEMNYTPQLIARNLATQKPHLLAVIVPSFTTPYYNEVLKGIKDEMENIDLEVMIYNTGSTDREKAMERFFEKGIADAVLVISIDLSDKIHQRLQARETPAVLINSVHPAYDYYEVNDYKGGYLAGKHLARQGFKSIGMITSSVESHSKIERRRGFMAALNEHNLSMDEDFFITGDSEKHAGFTEEAGFEAIEKFDKLARFPEAIFCSNDTQAIGAISALSKLDMKVPDDIAVMGYDNIKFSKYLDLTTIDQKMYTIGVKAITRLSELVNRSDGTLLQTSIKPVLVERGSTAKKKSNNKRSDKRIG